jgi:zinc transporter ZupT
MGMFSVPVVVATMLARAGAWAGSALRHAARRFRRPLIYLSLVFFAAVAIFDILPESKRALSWPVFAAAVVGGYGLFWLIGTYISPVCPSCALRSFEGDGHGEAHRSGLAILSLVLATHCFIDGVGISAAETVGATFGLRVFAAIAVHKLPEGFALVLVLTNASHSARQAFWWTCGIEVATIAGSIVGTFAHPSEFWLSLVLAHVGGTFLYLSASGLQDALSHPPTVVVAR